MPYADPKKQAEYLKKYARRMAERRNRQRRERYQETKLQEGQTVTPKPVKKSKRAKPRMVVGKRRRWVIYEGRLYTNSQLGFTMEDLVQMTQELQQHLQKQQAKGAGKRTATTAGGGGAAAKGAR